MNAHLIFKDGTTFEGVSFGSDKSRAGEIVFATGMVGYPESMTDPSYQGQILVLTYPIVGNYGVPDKRTWESPSIKVSGLVVSTYNDTPSHFDSLRSLGQWLKDEEVPGIIVKDTRFLAQKLRDEGSSLGKVVVTDDVSFYDPNTVNLIEEVSTKKTHVAPAFSGSKKAKTVLYIDCGGKKHMVSCLQERGANVIIVPWDFDPFEKKASDVILSAAKDLGVRKDSSPAFASPTASARRAEPDRNDIFDVIDGYVVSNGPGDPVMAEKTIATTKKLLDLKKPLLGICLGHQLLCLAGGGKTKKLKFGHRSQNAPCINTDTNRCYMTTQNHGFAVYDLPKGFRPWFQNANDGSNEGMIHERLPFMSTQFHPEATPGPQDTEWVFDYFLERIKK